MENQKLPPYTRLKTVLQEGNETLTSKAEKHLNELLELNQITKTDNKFTSQISKLFKKIDQLIFSNKGNLYNNKFRRRSRK